MEAKSLSELMTEARTALHMQRDSEELARRGEIQAKREEFTRAWAATFEACAKLLLEPLQPFLRGFPEFKPEEAYNDLPGFRERFELQAKGCVPITVRFIKAQIIPDGTCWALESPNTFSVALYEKNVDYFGEPEVAVCRVTDNFGPDSLLLALARAEESEQERLRLVAEVEQQKAERAVARNVSEKIEEVHREDPFLAEARKLRAALQDFLDDRIVELQE